MNHSFFDTLTIKKSVFLAMLACAFAAYCAFQTGANSADSAALQLNQAKVRWVAGDAGQLAAQNPARTGVQGMNGVNGEQGLQFAPSTLGLAIKPGPWQTVALPDPWSAYSPQRSGAYEYQLSFASPNAGLAMPQAAYIPRLGNRYQVWFNQGLIGTRGSLNDASIDLSHEPYFVLLPAGDWVAGENTLTLLVAGEQNRFAGVSTVWVGDAGSLSKKFVGRTFWQTFLSWVIIFISVSAGVLAWVVAYYSKIRYLIIFGLGSLAWGLRTGFLVTTGVVADYRWFLFAFDALFALAVGCFIVTAARVVKLKSKALNQFVRVYALLTPVLSALFAFGVPMARIALMGLMLGLVAWVAVLYVRSLRRGGAQHSTMLQWAFVMAIMFGAYDFVVILNMKAGYELFSLSKFSFVVTSVALASLFGSRLSRINAQLRISHQKINARLSTARRHLAAQYQVRADQERSQVLAQERWRLMQDMHDGLGGQLVSLHQAVSSPHATPELLARHVKFALDSLRMTVNALGQNHTNVAFMLGSIRERLEFLCQQYGKTLHWRVEDIPDLVQIDALKINELEKIVLELFTNIAKHSNATQVTLSAGYQPKHGFWLKVQENGSGYAVRHAQDALAGKGLTGLMQRAASIQARIVFDEQGTLVSITLAI